MDLVLLTKSIIEMIVLDKEAVSVRQFDTDDDNLVQLEVLVASDDLGRVIGRNGKTINSIRNIVQASSTLNGERRVKTEVDSY